MILDNNITKTRTANKVLPKAEGPGFYDTFVHKRTLVFQINRSAETPAFGNTQTVVGNCHNKILFLKTK
jgi:hypothetical protein